MSTKYPRETEMFKAEVCDRSKSIDPDEEYDWYSLSLGWAIAKGMSPTKAHNFSTYVRYDLGYFTEEGK